MDDFNPTPDSTEPEAFIQVSKPDEEGPSSEEGEVSSSTPAPAISASDVKPLIDIEDAKDEPEQDIAAPETDSPLSEELKTTTPSIAVCESKPAKELTSCPARWMKEHGVDDRVIDLIYWRCVKKTAIVFGTLLVVLISLSMYTLLSVLTFYSMAILTVSLLYRVGLTVMAAIQKSGSEHPLQSLLEKDIEISKEKATEIAEAAVDHINCAAKKLRKLFLVEDIVDSIKFGLFLWVLSYVGAWFSILTIAILDVVILFTVPKIYEEHQTQIDEYLRIAREKTSGVMDQIREKLPARFQTKEKVN